MVGFQGSLGGKKEYKIPAWESVGSWQCFSSALTDLSVRIQSPRRQNWEWDRISLSSVYPASPQGCICKHSKADHCCPVATQITEADTPRTAEGVKCHSDCVKEERIHFSGARDRRDEVWPRGLQLRKNSVGVTFKPGAH